MLHTNSYDRPDTPNHERVYPRGYGNSRYRQLAQRNSDGLTVVLWWDPEFDGVGIDVRDERSGYVQTCAVPRDHAMDAFDHPFVFLAEASR